MFVMTFGDIAAVIKPIPHVAITTEVQVAAVGVHNNRLSYAVVLRDEQGNITEQIGPYPAHAFRFLTHPDGGQVNQLFTFLEKRG